MHEEEKQAVKRGSKAEYTGLTHRARPHARKDVDARWTVKCRQGGGQDIAIPLSGCKSHITIDRRYGFIRACAVTDAARPPEDHQQT